MAPMVVGWMLSTSAGPDGAFIAFAIGALPSSALMFLRIGMMKPIRALARA